MQRPYESWHDTVFGPHAAHYQVWEQKYDLRQWADPPPVDQVHAAIRILGFGSDEMIRLFSGWMHHDKEVADAVATYHVM